MNGEIENHKDLDDNLVEDLTYEEAFKELEKLVARIESDPLNLETSLELFERGQQLIKHCSTLLEKAELRVKKIQGDQLLPFDLE